MSFASEQTANWKTFQSDYGYEFKYPECWEVGISDFYEKGELKRIKSLSLEAGKKCDSQIKNNGTDNLLSFNVVNGSRNSLTTVKKASDEVESHHQAQSMNNTYLYFKKTSKNNPAQADVIEHYPDKNIRWIRDIVCNNIVLSVFGPTAANPDKLLLEKIKGGDMSLPEPINTIYESVKCTKPKILSPKK
jgi:predicted DNA-binding antitoxin AbrB/MazE fold protein